MKKYICLLLLICIFGGGGCRNWLQVDLPADQLTNEAVFKDDVVASAALRGLYGDMNASRTMFHPVMTVTAALSADELLTVASNQDYDPFMNNDLPANNFVIGSMWSKAYKVLYIANDLIHKAAASTGMSRAKIDQVTGEALFVRAATLFYMTSLFDSIPMPLTPDYRQNASLARVSPGMVYDQMMQDLRKADSLLLPAYPTAGKARANKWSAVALQARLQLYRRQWKDAIAKATDVIDKGGYQLDSLDQSFLGGNREAIFQLASADITNNNTYFGFTFIPTGRNAPAYKVSPHLLDVFAAGDRRRQVWFSSVVVGDSTYVIPYKYRHRISSSSLQEFNTLLRLAEVYLIRAEAYAEDGQLALAIADLNKIRQRAGLQPLDASGMSPQQVKDAVTRERRAELNVEHGHRWLDLKRSGQLDVVMNAVKPGKWNSTDAFYPLPLTELLSNPALTQNDGYDD